MYKETEVIENPEIIEKTKALTVKVSINNNKGTGVVYAPRNHVYIYILTALHVLENFFDESPQNVNVTFFYFENGHMRPTKSMKKNDLEWLCIADPGEQGYPDVESYKGTAKDIAVLRIPADSFQENGREDLDFPLLRILPESHVENIKKLYGSGYPNNACAPERLTADKEDFLKDEGRYHLLCTNDNIVDFEGMMHGHSGGGLFTHLGNGRLHLACLTTGSKEHEKNNYFFGVPPYAILDKMKAHGWPDPRDEEELLPELDDSFVRAAVSGFFNRSFRSKEYNTVVKGIEDLKDAGLETRCFLEENQQDKFEIYGCSGCSSKIQCKNYLKGQLVKAFCFCKVNGEPIENLSDLTYTVTTVQPNTFWRRIQRKNGQNDEKINIEFICTDTNLADFIRSILENKFSVDGSEIPDSTIFIWNSNKGENMADYSEMYQRRQINHIMRDIVVEQDTSELSADGRRMLKGTEYNIVDGLAPEFNYAIIGTQKLIQTVVNLNNNHDTGCPEKTNEHMKQNLSALMKEVWG